MTTSTYGQFKLHKYQNVLIAHVKGPTDVASLLASPKETVAAVLSMGACWASLMDLREWELHTEEMVVHLIRFQKWLLKNGHKAEVALIGSSELKKAAREALLNQLETRPEQIYVETEDQAWQWLIENGYCDSKQEEA